MSLNDVETRSLAEISEALQRSDRRLARDLRRGRARLSTVDRVTVVLSVLVLGTLVVGITCQLRIVCAVAWTAVILLMVLRGMYGDGGY